MGYNGRNRKLRTSVFGRRQTRQGGKIMGNLITGLLGAGVVTGKALSSGTDSNNKGGGCESGCGTMILLLLLFILLSMCH